MKNVQVIVLLCLAAFSSLFLCSMNYYYFGRAQDYYDLRNQGARYGAIENTCLINASITEKRLLSQGIPARILVFHCIKENDSFSHALVCFESKGFLLVFDNDGSSVIAKLSDFNLKNTSDEIIKLRYKYVAASTWFEPPE